MRSALRLLLLCVLLLAGMPELRASIPKNRVPGIFSLAADPRPELALQVPELRLDNPLLYGETASGRTFWTKFDPEGLQGEFPEAYKMYLREAQSPANGGAISSRSISQKAQSTIAGARAQASTLRTSTPASEGKQNPPAPAPKNPDGQTPRTVATEPKGTKSDVKQKGTLRNPDGSPKKATDQEKQIREAQKAGNKARKEQEKAEQQGETNSDETPKPPPIVDNMSKSERNTKNQLRKITTIDEAEEFDEQ